MMHVHMNVKFVNILLLRSFIHIAYLRNIYMFWNFFYAEICSCQPILLPAASVDEMVLRSISSMLAATSSIG